MLERVDGFFAAGGGQLYFSWGFLITTGLFIAATLFALVWLSWRIAKIREQAKIEERDDSHERMRQALKACCDASNGMFYGAQLYCWESRRPGRAFSSRHKNYTVSLHNAYTNPDYSSNLPHTERHDIPIDIYRSAQSLSTMHNNVYDHGLIVRPEGQPVVPDMMEKGYLQDEINAVKGKMEGFLSGFREEARGGLHSMRVAHEPRYAYVFLAEAMMIEKKGMELMPVWEDESRLCGEYLFRAGHNDILLSALFHRPHLALLSEHSECASGNAEQTFQRWRLSCACPDAFCGMNNAVVAFELCHCVEVREMGVEQCRDLIHAARNTIEEMYGSAK